MAGRLILCGTPIGNLEDTAPRVISTLERADVIACEDTRRTKKLLTHFGIRAKDLVVLNDVTERRRSADLVDRIAGGATVALVSDAGMPGLSDPGFHLVRACAEAGLDVGVVPGPNAAVSALAVSGLPPGRFVFEGFLPRKPGERSRRVEELREETRTLVFYESPHRVAAMVAALAAGLGPRPAAVVRELTKLHEEVRRGTLEELAAWLAEEPPRGEIVVVVGGAVHGHGATVEPEGLARRARELMEAGVERKDALTQVAKELGVPRRRVFDALVEDGR